MLAEIGGELLIILVLTLANGFFSGSEIAIVSARKSRLEAKAKEGSGAARQALNLQANPDRFLATVQVGISLIGTFSAAFGGARIADVVADALRPAMGGSADTVALLAVVLFITYLSLVLGELVPKRLALQGAERWAMIAAPIMRTVQLIARPIVFILTTTVNVIIRLLRADRPADDSVTGEDIVFLAQEGAQSGTVEAGEAFFIQRAFEFTDRPIKSVMTPRTEMTAVDADAPLKDVVQKILHSHYTRIPVYEDNADHIIGTVHVKDVLGAALKANPVKTVRSLVRRTAVLPETAHIDEALQKFRVDGIHMAVIIDEYGQTAGIVTMEDLLEELVGEIRDEHDRGESNPYVKRDDGSWLVNGLEAYDRVVKRVGLPPPTEEEEGDFTTLAGMIVARLGRIAEEGDKVIAGDFEVEVIDMDGRRIDKVLVRRIEEPTDPSVAP
jgi:putative hemolysin